MTRVVKPWEQAQATPVTGQSGGDDERWPAAAGGRRSVLCSAHRWDGLARAVAPEPANGAGFCHQWQADGNIRSKRSGSSDNSFRVAGDKDDSRPGKLPGVFLGQVPAIFPRKVWGRFPRNVPGTKSSGLRPGQASPDARLAPELN